MTLLHSHISRMSQVSTRTPVQDVTQVVDSLEIFLAVSTHTPVQDVTAPKINTYKQRIYTLICANPKKFLMFVTSYLNVKDRKCK